jgi:hypothetical protein
MIRARRRDGGEDRAGWDGGEDRAGWDGGEDRAGWDGGEDRAGREGGRGAGTGMDGGDWMVEIMEYCMVG